MTTSYNIKELLPDVLTFAPYCTRPLVLRAIREASRQLCERVAVWRDTDCFEVSTPLYEGVCTLQDAAIVSIERARLNDTDLLPKTVQWLDAHYPDWTELIGHARYITQLAPDTVTITPRETGKLRLRLVLKPSLDAQTLPRVLATNYRSIIARGAAAIILTSPQADTTNPQLGAALANEFLTTLDTLAVDALKTQLGAPLRSRPNYF